LFTHWIPMVLEFPINYKDVGLSLKNSIRNVFK